MEEKEPHLDVMEAARGIAALRTDRRNHLGEDVTGGDTDMDDADFHTADCSPTRASPFELAGGIALDTDCTTVTTAATESSAEKLVPVALGPQHFELICVIGEGVFGKVLLVKPRLQSNQMHSNQPYAMKVISKKLLKKKNNVAYMKSERDIMTKVSAWERAGCSATT